jgi:hypothetical protein
MTIIKVCWDQGGKVFAQIQSSVREIDNFKATWHWPAFFVPFWWMLYRKLYGWAILAFFGIIPYIGLFLNVVWAITANYIYYKHARKKLLGIKQLHPSPETQRALSAAAGGVGDAWLPIGVPIGFIAIMLILGVTAIPMSRMQTVKAKLSEVTNIMSHVQSAEVAAKLDLGGYIDCVDASEIQSKLGLRFDTRYITKVNVIEGIITATIRNTTVFWMERL